MIDLTYDDHGLQDRLARVQVTGVMRGALARYGSVAVGMLRQYPAPPPSSTYRRTGVLGAGWRASVDGKDLRLTNATDYARWVQDKDTQTAVHKQTGWPTAQDVVEQVADKAAQDMVDALTGAMEAGL